MTSPVWKAAPRVDKYGFRWMISYGTYAGEANDAKDHSVSVV
jgi:hypothetical protein